MGEPNLLVISNKLRKADSEEAIMVLLPGYVGLKKKEALSSLIEISKRLYEKQQIPGRIGK